jgi:hypothetical protein
MNYVFVVSMWTSYNFILPRVSRVKVLTLIRKMPFLKEYLTLFRMVSSVYNLSSSYHANVWMYQKK